MRFRRILFLALLATLAVAAPASANYRVGLSEQSAAMFDQPAWQSLNLKRVRYLVPWDWYKNEGEVAEVTTYMQEADLHGQEVLVTFTAHRGCWNGKTYSRSKACKAPSQRSYASAIKRFQATYGIKLFTPWNEVNHPSQPTSTSPRLAAQYYATAKKSCRKCTVMAADLLDVTNAPGYLRSFLRFSKNKGRLWGLHNYGDVNRHRSRGLQTVLKLAPGEVWLTETGGIVTFLPNFRTSLSRAAAATKYMFQLADKYDTKLRGNKSKITRLYVYRWFGDKKGARFDAGLVGADGKPRASFTQFKKYLKKHLK